MAAVRVVEYVDSSDRSPYGRRFERLNAIAAAKVVTALYRLEAGNFSNVKGVGAGVFETRIDFGPGYRVYFGKGGETLIVLLGGSSKKDQRRAISMATEAWTAYKRLKRTE